MTEPSRDAAEGRPPAVDLPGDGPVDEAPARVPVLGGNRALGAGVALVGSILFALLLASGGSLLIGLARPGDGTRQWIDAYLANPLLAVPTLIFLVAFLILTAIANRAGWWAYIFGGLIVAAVVYAGSIAVLLLLQGGLQMSLRGAVDAALRLAVNPALVLGGLLARELVLWLGLGISRSGARLVRRHRAALDDFERRAVSGASQPAVAAPHESVDGSSGRRGSFDGPRYDS
ncbi:hypothetical protein [Arenivirga flava]|uniref:hypothetical protein n=1 Tax=Arenivirga flava TaxID=1930060 RepID=UPI0024E0EC45|nr:hypothetical protein [Arenivirga flava]